MKKLATRGVSQANISAGKLREFGIPLTDLDEQREIVTILDTIDRKIDLHGLKETCGARRLVQSTAAQANDRRDTGGGA